MGSEDRVEQLIDLKKKAQRLQSKIDQNKGVREEQMRALKDEWKCSSLDEARELLKSKTKELKRLQRSFDLEMEKFLNEFGDKL